jgi:hypothetical protein
VNQFTCNNQANQRWRIENTSFNYSAQPAFCDQDCNSKNGFTGCGIVCSAAFNIYYGQAIAAFKGARAAGVAKCAAQDASDDGGALYGLLVKYNFGGGAGVLAKMAAQGCGRCAVDSAY